MTKHVVSKPLAQKLKAVGYPQETEFYWWIPFGNEWQIVEKGATGNFTEADATEIFTAAPLASEIELLMPRLGDRSDLSIDIWSDTTSYEFCIKKK